MRYQEELFEMLLNKFYDEHSREPTDVELEAAYASYCSDLYDRMEE